MFYTHFSFFKGTGRVGQSVAYIAHREEHLPGGQTRELYGLGKEYRALEGREREIVRTLRRDGHGLVEPRYFRIRLTVDDRAAERLMRLGAGRAEHALRDAVEKTFRGAFRTAQGVFVVHHNEQGNRPFGNPHVHVLLGPRLSTGQTFYVPKRLHGEFRERWHREMERVLDRFEGRFRALEHEIEIPVPARKRGRRALGRERLHPGLMAATAHLSQGRVRAAVKTAARSAPGVLGRAAKLPRVAEEAAMAPERLARRYALNLLLKFMPGPVQRVIGLARTGGLLLPRE